MYQISLAVTIWTYMRALAATRRPRILIIHTYIKAHTPIYIIAHNPHMSIGKNKYFVWHENCGPFLQKYPAVFGPFVKPYFQKSQKKAEAEAPASVNASLRLIRESPQTKAKEKKVVTCLPPIEKKTPTAPQGGRGNTTER